MIHSAVEKMPRSVNTQLIFTVELRFTIFSTVGFCSLDDKYARTGTCRNLGFVLCVSVLARVTVFMSVVSTYRFG